MSAKRKAVDELIRVAIEAYNGPCGDYEFELLLSLIKRTGAISEMGPLVFAADWLIEEIFRILKNHETISLMDLSNEAPFVAVACYLSFDRCKEMPQGFTTTQHEFAKYGQTISLFRQVMMNQIIKDKCPDFYFIALAKNELIGEWMYESRKTLFVNQTINAMIPTTDPWIKREANAIAGRSESVQPNVTVNNYGIDIAEEYHREISRSYTELLGAALNRNPEKP